MMISSFKNDFARFVILGSFLKIRCKYEKKDYEKKILNNDIKILIRMKWLTSSFKMVKRSNTVIYIM